MDTNKMREQFEAFWLKSDYSQGLGEASLVRVWMGDPQSDYAITRTQYLWTLWQAFREAVVVELPPVRPEPVLTGEAQKADGEAATWSMWAGEKLAKDDCRAAIEAQGLKVAP